MNDPAGMCFVARSCRAASKMHGVCSGNPYLVSQKRCLRHTIDAVGQQQACHRHSRRGGSIRNARARDCFKKPERLENRIFRSAGPFPNSTPVFTRQNQEGSVNEARHLP